MKLIWEIPYDFIGIGITTTPLLLGDSLVIMTAGKDLVAIEQKSGSIRWRSFVSMETNLQTDELKTDGTLLFATHVQDVRAYRISDGGLQWLVNMPEERGGFWSDEIAYESGRLYVSGYRTVYCLDGVTGNLLWSRKLQDRGLLGSVKLFQNDVVIGGGYGVDDSNGVLVGIISRMYMLSGLSGDTLWTRSATGDGDITKIAVDDSVVYEGTHFPFSTGSFLALSLPMGSLKWNYSTPGQGWDYNDVITVGDKVIANAGPYNVCAFKKSTGELLWRTFVREDAESRKLHYYDGYIYHTQGWRLYVIDPNTGNIVHSMNGPTGQALVTLAVENGRVFVQGHPSLQCYEAYKP